MTQIQKDSVSRLLKENNNRMEILRVIDFRG